MRTLLAASLAFVMAGCSSAARHAQPARPSSEAPARHCRSATVAAGSTTVAVAAVVRSRVVAFRRPGIRPFATFGRRNQNGFPTVFRVVSALQQRDCSVPWLRVQLPIRPNGVIGYVRSAAVDTGRVRSRVLVDVSSRRLTLLHDGRQVLSTAVAVGSPATPTPTGSYYVDQRLIPDDPAGPFGPAAIGISAYSNVLTGWTQGGPIAIHGTNEPWSIGRAVSNGCIRVGNATLRRIFALTPAGTPVVIRG